MNIPAGELNLDMLYDSVMDTKETLAEMIGLDSNETDTFDEDMIEECFAFDLVLAVMIRMTALKPELEGIFWPDDVERDEQTSMFLEQLEHLLTERRLIYGYAMGCIVGLLEGAHASKSKRTKQQLFQLAMNEYDMLLISAQVFAEDALILLQTVSSGIKFINHMQMYPEFVPSETQIEIGKISVMVTSQLLTIIEESPPPPRDSIAEGSGMKPAADAARVLILQAKMLLPVYEAFLNARNLLQQDVIMGKIRIDTELKWLPDEEELLTISEGTISAFMNLLFGDNDFREDDEIEWRIELARLVEFSLVGHLMLTTSQPIEE